MKSKKYSLTLTEETFEVLNSLEREGYNLRTVLNAGVILFDEADLGERGRSSLIASSKLVQELDFCETRLRHVLNFIDARKGRGAFTPELEKRVERFLRALDTDLADDTIRVTKDVLQSKKVPRKKNSHGKTA